MIPSKNKYSELLTNIGSTLQKARENAIKAINTELGKANQEIGKNIVEFEQNGKERAEYGSALLTNLAKDLKAQFGKGFGKTISTYVTSFISNIQFSRQCPEN